MIPLYTPILKAKAGEFQALANTRKSIASRVLPLLELPPIDEKVTESNWYKEATKKTEIYLDRLTNHIGSAVPQTQLMIDISYWPANAKVENGKHVLGYVFDRLTSKGISMCPVVGYDRWEDPIYRAGLAKLEAPADRLFCIRLDADAIGEFDDPEFFTDRVSNILNGLSLLPQNTSVLIDFGDVTGVSIEDMQEATGKGLGLLTQWPFKFIGLAGSSLPVIITDILPKPHSECEVLRREMVCWQMASTNSRLSPVVFSDYGVRNPIFNDEPKSSNANGKIRYTTRNNFFVVRGHAMTQGNKGKQYYGLADIVLKSGHYCGPEYSWGDSELLARSDPTSSSPGSLTDWIAIDTNHHIAAVFSEVTDFQRKITAVQAKTIAAA
jgi:hypothetical protein